MYDQVKGSDLIRRQSVLVGLEEDVYRTFQSLIGTVRLL